VRHDLDALRYQFLYAPRLVTKRYADLHAGMTEHWLGLWLRTRRWRYLRAALRSAFLAGWTMGTGSTYSYDTNPRNRPIIRNFLT
jgi:hypothetical protein